MFPHLQADSCAGIDKYLVTSVVNWDHLGLDHMDTPRPQWCFQEMNQPVGVGKSGLRSEEKSQFSLNSCTGQAGTRGTICPHGSFRSQTQAKPPLGNGEIQFHWSCSYRVEFGEEGMQWGHFYFPDISEASLWTEREIFLSPSLSSELKSTAWAWWVLMP